jgi:DNA (cytosine-5)-methyltransferase 1
MKPQLILSLFPGIGLLDRAFEEAGFCIVRGPDLLWGGDVRSFHPPSGRFDGVIGGPPCQAHSPLAHLARATGAQVAPDLIPEFARCVAEASPLWWLMENVRRAPAPELDGYAVWAGLLNARDFGAVQNRERCFRFGIRGEMPTNLWRFLDLEALHPARRERAVCAAGCWSPMPRRIRRKDGRETEEWYKLGASREGVRDSCRLQGLPESFFDGSPFTARGQQQMLGNGVPLPMGRAIAQAIRRALEDLP